MNKKESWKIFRLIVGILIVAFGISFSLLWFNLESFNLSLLSFIISSGLFMFIAYLVMSD